MSAGASGIYSRDHLRTIARGLQDLHRVLLDYQRREYERFAGRIGSDFYLLTLAAEDPQFAWLRALSAEMMHVDILLASKGEIDPVELRLAGTRLRFLLTPTSTGNNFQSHYERAMPTNPDIIMAHATAMRSLPAAPAASLFRSDPPTDIRTSDDVPGFEMRPHHPGNLIPGNEDHGYRALAAIAEVTIPPSAVMPSHAYANEDVVTWAPDGVVRFEDPDGRSLGIDPGHLLVLNAGTGVRFTLTAQSGESQARLLQAFVRPSRIGGEPQIQHGVIPEPASEAWRTLVAPEGADAPFHVRNDVQIQDIVLQDGNTVDLPAKAGWDTYVFVSGGMVDIDGVPLTASRGGLVMAPDNVRVTAREPSRLVAFMIDPAARVTRAGTTAR